MLFFLWACTSEKVQVEESIDLTEILSATETRAGEITNSSALFGGTSAEGQVGDYKIYNNKVQFIVQANRPSSYYISEGGGLLDADIVRSSGEQGRDIIDEHTPMAAFGQILKPNHIEVVSDGVDAPAKIRVTGTGTAFELLEGAVENENMVPDRAMTFTVDYLLQPNSSLLEITTTIDWNDVAQPFQPSNVILVGREVVDWWNPGGGYFGESNTQWFGAIGKRNEVALALFPTAPNFTPSVIQPLLEDATPAMSGFEEMVTLEAGQSVTFTQYVGVGRDFASLTNEWYALQGTATQHVEGTVTDGNYPVAGARVHIFDDQDVLTLAVTDENGFWSAEVPNDASVSYQASGRGHAENFDVPIGSGWYSIYADETVEMDTLASYSEDVDGGFAEGYGVAEVNSDVLVAPGWLDVSTADAKPAVVLVDRIGEDTQASMPQVPGRPSGHSSMGYIRDGAMSIPVEPGEYQVTVHRGTMCEYAQFVVTVESGARQEISATIDCLELPEGVVSIDPHTHSSPSGDARVSSVERLITHAAHGVDIHVSTEHDHVADYTALVEALGLDSVLTTVVGAEISPPLRGHHNAYPLTVQKGEINNGALSWWSAWTTTTDLHNQIRALLPEFGVLQANHPVGSSGLFESAAYNIEQGVINKPDYWSENFDVMELINDGYYAGYVPYYFDLISRGYGIGAVAVSDSHTHTSGVGVNRTFVMTAGNESEDLFEGIANGRTVPSRGPYLHVTIDGEFAPGSVFVGEQVVSVEVFHPSWMDIDTLELYENGVVIETVSVEDGEYSFTVNPEMDSHYAISAFGTFPMSPLYGDSPWAISAVFFVDSDGDGWTAPLSPLSLGQ